MASFSLNLHKRVEQRFVASGKFDGSHACLAAATSSGNVLVHSPHRQPTISTQNPRSDDEHSDGRLSWAGEVAELQIGAQVTSLCTGRLGDDERDVLFIGTPTHVLAYHVEDNADLFYKEMPDGAYSLCVGKLGWLPSRGVIVGGNGSITILDLDGTEIFWTVMGDKVTAVSIFDFDGDGQNELLSGTEGFEVKVLKENSILWETKETAAVQVLSSLPNKQFAYAVGNGTVGVYESGQRLWRIKSKHRVVAVKCYDVNGDGVAEVVTGWSSGKVDARSCTTGEVIFRIQLQVAVAGLVDADYRRTGRPDLVIVSVAGEVRGYAPGSLTESPEPGETLRELLAQKHALQSQIRQRSVSISNMYHGTRLAVSVAATRGAVRLALASGPGLLVYCAVIFAEGVFEGETHVTHPARPTGELEIALRPPKNGPVDIHVKTCIGPPGADLMQVFEMTRQLPRFAMYQIIAVPTEIPEALKNNSGLIIEVAERPQRIALWLNQSLIMDDELDVHNDGPNAGNLELWLRCLRDEKIHCLTAMNSGKVVLLTEDPEFAGDVVQSLCSYLGLGELSSEANFPAEEKRMIEVLEKVKGLKEVEARLEAEAAGGSNLLKDLVVRLEDARILGNVADIKKRLSQLKAINADLSREHEIRASSYRELAATLKELNIGVQHAARFRVGKAATNAVARCRAAIQDENPKALVLAIKHG